LFERFFVTADYVCVTNIDMKLTMLMYICRASG